MAPPVNDTEKRPVLIVEDDDLLRSILVDSLKRRKFNVFEAQTGPEAIQIAKREHPFILLDIILPSPIDGFEVLWRLRDNPDTATLPVIILSNLGGQEDEKRGRELGALSYLVKAHVTPKDVVEAVERHAKRQKDA